ncbi:hypothetical protein ABH922_004244 [Rhodococcus sp. 27YEA15]
MISRPVSEVRIGCRCQGRGRVCRRPTTIHGTRSVSRSPYHFHRLNRLSPSSVAAMPVSMRSLSSRITLRAPAPPSGGSGQTLAPAGVDTGDAFDDCQPARRRRDTRRHRRRLCEQRIDVVRRGNAGLDAEIGQSPPSRSTFAGLATTPTRPKAGLAATARIAARPTLPASPHESTNAGEAVAMNRTLAQAAGDSPGNAVN